LNIIALIKNHVSYFSLHVSGVEDLYIFELRLGHLYSSFLFMSLFLL